MPSRSKSQKKFFELVRRLQKGEIHPSDVSPEIRKAAKTISSKDVQDFTSTPDGNLPYKVKKEIISILKEIRRPMFLKEEEVNPISKTFTQKGKYDEYVKRFIGMSLSPKEMEAINSHKETKPSKVEKNQIRYETSDSFGNNTLTTIKKLKDGNEFSFTAFTKYSSSNQEKTEEMDEIVITKSIVFKDEIEEYINSNVTTTEE